MKTPSDEAGLYYLQFKVSVKREFEILRLCSLSDYACCFLYYWLTLTPILNRIEVVSVNSYLKTFAEGIWINCVIITCRMGSQTASLHSILYQF